MRGSFSGNVRTGMKSLRRWENNKWASADLHSAPAVQGFFYFFIFYPSPEEMEAASADRFEEFITVYGAKQTQA